MSAGRFADDIGALAEEEQELEALVESLDKTCTRYKIKDQTDDKQHQWHAIATPRGSNGYARIDVRFPDKNDKLVQTR